MDKLDAAGADTRVVKRLVLGALGPTHPTDVRFLCGVHLDWLVAKAALLHSGQASQLRAMTASYLHVNISN